MATMRLQYRIEWPNDVRHELVKGERFPTKEIALQYCRGLWGGCFELHLRADADPGHYYCAPLHFTQPGRCSPRTIPGTAAQRKRVSKGTPKDSE